MSLDETADSGATFEYDVRHSFFPTLVEIRNLQPGGVNPSNIVLAGRLSPFDPNNPLDVAGVSIENPVGNTLIDNQRGNIVVSASPAPAFELLRTNVLTLNADDGSIGTHTAAGGVITSRLPVPVELVQFADDAGVLQPITVAVEAGMDAVLDLRAVRRETTSATPLAVTIDSFRAGRDADLHILDAVEELSGASSRRSKSCCSTRPAAIRPRRCSAARRAIRSRMTPPCRNGRSGSGYYHRHFRPDSGGAYTQVGAFGGDRTTIDSDYTFADIRAGNDISIQHGRNASGGFDSTISLTATTDVDATLVDLNTGAALATADDAGKIDMTTNGFVTVTEPTGDLRAGDITSTASDVTLTAAQSIVDAEMGTGVLGTDPTPTDVTGQNLTLTATAGGIGLDANFLEINSSFAADGVLIATALGTIRIEEALGDLRVDTVVSQTENVTLATVNGSILDRNPLTFLREGRTVDLPNVSGVSIDLAANGGSLGEAGDDLDLDSRTTLAGPLLDRAADGRVYLEATGSIFVTETDRELNLLAADAAGGLVRLTVPDTARGAGAPPR